MDSLKLSIVTPHGEIFSSSVKSVTLPGSEGEFGIYPGHCDLLSLLKSGVIEISRIDDAIEMVAVDWGYANISSDSITVLASGAVSINGEGSDIAIALEEAKGLLESASNDKIATSSVLSKIDSISKKRI